MFFKEILIFITFSFAFVNANNLNFYNVGGFYENGVLVKEYLLSKQNFKWSEGEAFCIKNNLKFAAFTRSSETSSVLKLVTDFSNTNKDAVGRIVHINGKTDVALSKGNYYWASAPQVKVGLENWAPEQPNFSFEFCLSIGRWDITKDKSYAFHDISCDLESDRYQVLCQIETEPFTTPKPTTTTATQPTTTPITTIKPTTTLTTSTQPPTTPSSTSTSSATTQPPTTSTTTTSLPPTATPLPTKFYPIGTFNTKSYFLSEKRMTWIEADEFCCKNGMKFASLSGCGECNVALGLLTTFWKSNKDKFTGNVFLNGATNVLTSKKSFHWTTAPWVNLEYEKWINGEPNNLGDEYCLDTSPSNDQIMLNDEDCDKTTDHVLCEKQN